MPTPRNTAYAPAIAALRVELAELKSRTAETRSLLVALTARASIAGSPAAPPGEPAVPSCATRRASLVPKSSEPVTGNVASEKTYKTKHGTKPKTTAAPAKPNDDKAAATELATVAATIAEAAEQAAVASRDKDVKNLKAAIAAALRAERRAGELLAVMNGRVRRLPGEERDKRRWRAVVLLSAQDFEKTVRRSQRRALAAIGVGPAPAKRSPRSPPRSPPKPEMKLSDWQQSADGSLTRTLTAVDGGGAEVAG